MLSPIKFAEVVGNTACALCAKRISDVHIGTSVTSVPCIIHFRIFYILKLFQFLKGTYSKIAYLFDHPGTVAFAVFVSFWGKYGSVFFQVSCKSRETTQYRSNNHSFTSAVTFLEYWKRYSVSLAHRWDIVNVEREEVRPRPEFALKAPSIERNPVTGIPEPSFPLSVRRKRIVAGFGFVILMVAILFQYAY
jgi:Calcium-activated chloride channel